MPTTLLLPTHPSPRQQMPVAQPASPYLTPPPSPRLRSTSPAEFKHFGYLKPINKHSPHTKLYALRSDVSDTGRGSTVAELRYSYCTISLKISVDGTTESCTIKSDRYRVEDKWSSESAEEGTSMGNEYMSSFSRNIQGTSLNNEFLEANTVYDLQHGDILDFDPYGFDGSDDPDIDQRFIWLQCEKGGWRPLDYEQDTGIEWRFNPPS